MKKAPQTAAAYIRVSTDEQLELSPDSQREKISEYAAAHGIELPERFIFIEGERKKGLSGRSAKNRPKFQEMIALAKEKPKPFDCILLWKFSRFARNIDAATYYKSVLRNKCGIDVISVSEPISEGMYGRLVEMIIEWSDEFYSFNLAGEVRRGMSARAKAGEFSSYAPIGYKMSDKRLIIDEMTAPAVREVFNAYICGTPPSEIAAALNGQGITTRFGNPVSPRFITYMITNPIYKGYIAFSPEGRRKKADIGSERLIYRKGIHEPIVDEALWESCFERYLASKGTKRRASQGTEYTLRSLLVCSACGSPLTNTGKGYLQCSKYNRGLCRLSHAVGIAESEEKIRERLCADTSPEVITELNSLSPQSRNEILLQIIEKIVAHKTEDGYDFEIFYR